MHLVNISLRLSSLVLIILITACQKDSDPPTANFTLENDANVRGKVNLTNSSSGAESYFWELWEVQPDGTKSISSNYTVSTSRATNPSFYILENGTIGFELTAFNADGVESVIEKTIEVTNIPSKMTVEKLVITYVSLLDEDGFEWDDIDGIPNDFTYTIPEEYPDLLVNNLYYKQNTSYEASKAHWDVDIENGLPYEMTAILQTEFETFSPQTDEYYIELIDFDGMPGFPGLQGGQQIDVHTVNPYHLTHEYNDGSDDNFPDIYYIKDDNFEGELHMNWE